MSRSQEDEITMKSIDNLWSIIVEDVIARQNNDGSVENDIIEGVYPREVAFSANILATNYLKSKNDKDRLLAEKNCSFISCLLDNSVVFDEPIWTPRGLGSRKGSLPATVFLFWAYAAACEKLGQHNKIQQYREKLINYVSECRLKNGLYAHDAVIPGETGTALPVVNTTLMAEWLLSSIGGRTSNDLTKILKSAQLRDGSWPYHFSTFLPEALLYKCLPVLPFKNRIKSACLRFVKDRSIFFNDMLHILVTLHFAMLLCKPEDTAAHDMICKALDFVERNTSDCTNGMKINFDWEPQPNYPRYSNFKDTTSYFVLMDIYRLGSHLGILSAMEANIKINQLAKHVVDNLICEPNDAFPYPIMPYEGSQKEVNLIFPRPAESVFHKGQLLANVVYYNHKIS